jgi:hypothetical protein
MERDIPCYDVMMDSRMPCCDIMMDSRMPCYDIIMESRMPCCDITTAVLVDWDLYNEGRYCDHSALCMLLVEAVHCADHHCLIQYIALNITALSSTLSW